MTQADAAYFDIPKPAQGFNAPMPILDEWVARDKDAAPLKGVTALLIQHQLTNHVPQLAALIALGLDAKRVHWLDIPYSSHDAVRAHAHEVLGVPAENLAKHDYRVLAPYAPYQLARAVAAIRQLGSMTDGMLLVLDDGAYAAEALAGLHRSRWPRRIAMVEQTSHGFNKLTQNAMLRAVAREVPIVNVAKSKPKRELEPAFIAMAVCAALKPRLDRHFGSGPIGRCLVLGYGAIGAHVSSWLWRYFGLSKEKIHVHDVDPAKAALAQRRGYPAWNRDDLGTRFELVIGCSGSASFSLGDAAYLEEGGAGALLVSASSGAVELSRQEFIEQANASSQDDIFVHSEGLETEDVHSDLRVQLVDRVAVFANGGFPVNFTEDVGVVPAEFMQPTVTMMVAAAVQAVRLEKRGLQDLDPVFCAWIDPRFRTFLGPMASLLELNPEAA